MKVNSIELIQALQDQTQKNIDAAERLKGKSLSQLTWRENENSWNMLECLEHLNLYASFYRPKIKEAMDSCTFNEETTFRSGWLGNYFANSMKPKEKLNKMKTFNDKNPIHRNLNSDVIDLFITEQTNLLDLLNQAKKVSLNRVRIGISIAPWIKLKLGDTFRFIINHNARHIAQIARIEKAMERN